MRAILASVCIAIVLSGLSIAGEQAGEAVINFEKAEVGKLPDGFSTATTGRGAEGVWVVKEDDKAPAGPKVLAQTSDDRTGNRFPVCVYDAISAQDVDVSVQFKPVSGEKDQAAGIVWRYQDKDNYFVVRANALENNVVAYKVVAGKRTSIGIKGDEKSYGVKAEVPSGQWSTLRVVAVGNLFEIFLNGRSLFQVENATFPGRGKVGLWTKADSVTLFDNLRITVKDAK